MRALTIKTLFCEYILSVIHYFAISDFSPNNIKNKRCLSCTEWFWHFATDYDTCYLWLVFAVPLYCPMLLASCCSLRNKGPHCANIDSVQMPFKTERVTTTSVIQWWWILWLMTTIMMRKRRLHLSPQRQEAIKEPKIGMQGRSATLPQR